jgi:hypothetical protein
MTRGSLEKHLFKSKHTLQIKLQLLTFQTFFTAHLSISYSDTSLHTCHVIFLYMPAARVKLNTRTHTASREPIERHCSGERQRDRLASSLQATNKKGISLARCCQAPFLLAASLS